jgi:hypothetical protein
MLHPLFAYLDPGTGSMLIQTVIGAVAGAAYIGRKWLAIVAATGKRYISGLLKRGNRQDKA